MVIRSLRAFLLAVTMVCTANASNERTLVDPVQGYSLLGDALVAPAPESETLEKMLEARRDFERYPDDADKIIWYGRRLAYTGDYRGAIRVFSAGIDLHPGDARMYRHRGHRYITLREFDRAIADLEQAAKLVEGTENRMEPDGLPNALNIPVSTLHGNIWYHLGLAYYLKHDWRNAWRAFQAGFESGGNDDNRVATTHWRYMILRRMGKAEQAQAILRDIGTDMRVIENMVYHRLCLMYKGNLSTEEVAAEDAGSPIGTAAAYGIANWHWYEGAHEEAVRRLQAILKQGDWASFGFIAAEADLAALRQ